MKNFTYFPNPTIKDYNFNWDVILESELSIKILPENLYTNWVEFYNSDIVNEAKICATNDGSFFAFSLNEWLLTVTKSEHYNHISQHNSKKTIDIITTNVQGSMDLILFFINFITNINNE